MKSAPDVQLEAMNAFHDHLDACARCRDEPFNLCATGAKLLKAFAATAELK